VVRYLTMNQSDGAHENHISSPSGASLSAANWFQFLESSAVGVQFSKPRCNLLRENQTENRTSSTPAQQYSYHSVKANQDVQQVMITVGGTATCRSLPSCPIRRCSSLLKISQNVMSPSVRLCIMEPAIKK
jgi:hypothetical protein